MDPEVTYRDLLATARGLDAAGQDGPVDEDLDVGDLANLAQLGVLLARHVLDLNDHLTRGGQPPRAWRRQGPPPG